MDFGIGESYALASAFAWAVAVILFKRSGEQLPPFELNLVKNLLATVLLAVTVWLLAGAQLPHLGPVDIGLTVASGVLGIAVGDTLYFRALNLLGASRMGVAQTLYSPCVILLSVMFLGERLYWWQVGGVALVLGGILLVSYVGKGISIARSTLVLGFTLAAASVFMMALGIVLAKPLLVQHDFLWIVFLRTATGLLGMLLLVAWRRQWRSLWQTYRGVRRWPVIVAGAVCGTYLAMIFWLAGYKYTDMSVAAVLNELAAVFILVLAVIFLREKIGRRQILGTLLAVLGVALVVARPSA